MESIPLRPAKTLSLLVDGLYTQVVFRVGLSIQWSLYLKTTQGTKIMRSYIAGGLKIKGI